MEWLQPYQGLVVFGAGIFITVVSLAIRSKMNDAISGKANVAEVNAIGSRLQVIEGRLLSVETGLRYMPTAEGFSRIEVALADQRGDMRAMTEKVDGLREMMEAQASRIDMIDEHLKGLR